MVEGIARPGGTAQISLRSTERVRGQTVKRFKANPALVARCYTIVDALEELLRAEGRKMPVSTPSVDALAVWHTDPLVV